MRRALSILVALLLISVAVSCQAEEASQAQTFEQEYEILNGLSNMDGTNVYKSIDIPSDNAVKYVDLAQVLDIIDQGTGIIYLGFPECPWCRTLVPVLFESVAQTGYTGPIYYCNFLEQRDKKTLDENGKIVVEQEGTPEYAKLVEVLSDWLTPYSGLNDDTIKRVYFPTTVFVKDGEIIDVHLDTVDSQEDGYAELTEDQHAELLSALTADIKLIVP